jgi:four helix bundle protein
MQNFRDLKVWERAHRVALDVYRLSSMFPREEAFGLTSQMRRAAVSIASNIAEGRGSGSEPLFGRFLRTAMGSACELECQLLLARDLEFARKFNYEELLKQVEEVKRMLTGLLQSLER